MSATAVPVDAPIEVGSSDSRPLAVVTGASSGLGEAIARRLSDRGYRVLLVARRADRLAALAGELAGAVAVEADLLAPEGPSAVLAAVDAAGGRLSVLVNNAGIGGRGTFAEAGYAGVRQTMDLNFDAQLRLTEALLPAVRAAAPSSILFVSSVSGKIARPGAGAYSASKFALNGWAEALRAEEGAGGVHVGTILPGFIATEGFPQRELLAKRTTRWLVGKPEMVADAAEHLIRTRRPERHAPPAWRLMSLLAAVAPRLVARIVAAPEMTPSTTTD
ncbi:MAG: SDR family NAD(P)-dependent oxidoreductase [Solirubrobacteraceae bacterium]|nr:SDR family NAD(P)-dependent oxidoreductase [Solirubrobacteraceae bacterium]